MVVEHVDQQVDGTFDGRPVLHVNAKVALVGRREGESVGGRLLDLGFVCRPIAD